MIVCSFCKKTIDTLSDDYPLYYLGAGPNNPEDAEFYFCDAYCSNSFVRERKHDKKN